MILLILLLLFQKPISSSSSSLVSSSTSSNTSVSSDAKLRFGKGGRRDHRQVHRIYADEDTSRFGDALPSFAYDFSELFLGAVIERSLDSDDLHLSMILLGKKTIHLKDDSTSPFKSVSTDIETIEMWTKASDSVSWISSNSNGIDSHDGSDTSRNNDGSRYLRSQSHMSSGLSCRLQNEATKPPYLTTATWIPSNTFSDPKHNGMIEVLRCKVKHSHHAYKILATSDEMLRVDIVRRRSNKEQGQNVISFAIPWRTRHVGYGLHFVNGTSLFDPWQYQHMQRKQHFVFVSSIFDVTGAASSNASPTELNILEAIPKIITFIEYYTSIGISHFFINLPLSTESPLMKTMHQALSHYIDSGYITLVTTAMNGVDGASGFLGIIYKSWFVENIVQTSLLYLIKGVAPYVLKLTLLDYLALTDTGITSTQQLIAKYQPSITKRDRPCFFSVSVNGSAESHYLISTKYNGFLYDGSVGACRVGQHHRNKPDSDINYLASVNISSDKSNHLINASEEELPYTNMQYNKSIPASVALVIHMQNDTVSKLDKMMKEIINDHERATNRTAKQVISSHLPLFQEEVYLYGGENFPVQLLLALHRSSFTWKEGMWMNSTNVHILYNSLKEISHQPSRDSVASKLEERLKSLPDFDGSNTTTNQFELFDSKTDSFIGTAIRWENQQIIEPFFKTVKPPLSKMIKEIL